MDLKSWDDVRLFLAVVRQHTLTGAARTLGMDQSTASRRLLALERAMGVRLFDRVPGGLEPTAAAASVVALAEAAEAQVVAFSAELAGADGELEGTVRLAVPEAMDAELVLPAVPALRARYPGIRLEVVASNSIANLARREADLALRLVRPRGGELVVRKAAVLHTAVYGRAAHARKGLARAPWVDGDEGHGEPRERQWMSRHVRPEQVVVRTNRVEGRLAAARAGLGLAVLSRPLGARHGELVEVPAEEPPPAYDVWLVGHPGLVRVPRVRVVWDFLAELCQRISGGAIG